MLIYRLRGDEVSGLHPATTVQSESAWILSLDLIGDVDVAECGTKTAPKWCQVRVQIVVLTSVTNLLARSQAY